MNALVQALHARALEVVSRYQKAEADLLDILEKLDEKKVFRALGYPSLFQYALKELKLSESTAYNFITVARKAREIPEIKMEIKSGNISVSKVSRIVSVIEKETAISWLEKAKSLPKAALEKEVAKVSPQVLTPEKSTYVTEQRRSLQLGVNEELYEKLNRVKDILSQKMKRAATLEDALDAMASLFIEKNDPVEKANRAKKDVISELCLGRVPAANRHTVMLRDQGQCCETLPSGERCEQKRWLEVHHVKPRKDGGGHAVNNLQLLCFSHHRVKH